MAVSRAELIWHSILWKSRTVDGLRPRHRRSSARPAVARTGCRRHRRNSGKSSFSRPTNRQPCCAGGLTVLELPRKRWLTSRGTVVKPCGNCVAPGRDGSPSANCPQVGQRQFWNPPVFLNGGRRLRSSIHACVAAAVPRCKSTSGLRLSAAQRTVFALWPVALVRGQRLINAAMTLKYSFDRRPASYHSRTSMKKRRAASYRAVGRGSW